MYRAAGKRIREIRERRNLSRAELSIKTEISEKFLYEVEVGRKGFSAEILYRISKALHISSDYILKGNFHLDEEKDIYEILIHFSPEQVDEVLSTLNIIYRLCKLNN